jgi:zinc transport system substrate-binding protein
MKKLCILLLAGLAACSPAESKAGASPVEEGGRLLVYTVNYPLAYFAEWIGGQAVRVEFPAPADQDPASWTPDPETIVAYQAADLILLNGAGYAKWVERATLPASRTINTGMTQKKRLIEVAATVTHTHGPEGEHSHGETAFTTWLDPTFALEQARTITFVLSGARPQFAEDFEANLAALEAELRELDERWQAIVATDPERPLLGSHPVYQYLDAHLGLNLESVHWEPDAMPDEDLWRELATLLESHPARFMLWEGEPLPEVVERLRGLGVESVVFDPCAQVPENADDFLDVMQANAEALEAAF